MSFPLHPDRDALFLDIDGTLLDIAPTPHAVTVPVSLKTHLTHLHRKLGGALALISGRSIDDMDKLFAPLRLPASGVHGAEWRIVSEREERKALPSHIRRAVSEEIQRYRGIFLEDKTYALAVHYRAAPDMERSIGQFLKSLIQHCPELSLMPGKMVWEVVYHGHHKGTAVKHFMRYRPFAGRRPVFLGDDETDVFAMRACLELGGAAASVGRSRAQAYSFSNPGDVRRWIEEQAQ